MSEPTVTEIFPTEAKWRELHRLAQGDEELDELTGGS